MFGTIDRVLEIIRRWILHLLASFGPELIANGSFEVAAGHGFPDTATKPKGQGIQRWPRTTGRFMAGWSIPPATRGSPGS